MESAFHLALQRANVKLDAEMKALSLDDEFYRVIGNSASAGVIVSRTDEPVDFASELENRIVNLVPVPDITRVPRWTNESTQTVGIYPESLRLKLREDLSLHGVQRVLPLGVSIMSGESKADPAQALGIPHDGIEPMRRMVRWVIDQSVELV